MDGNSRVRVYARVRPLFHEQEGLSSCLEVDQSAQAVKVHSGGYSSCVVLPAASSTAAGTVGLGSLEAAPLSSPAKINLHGYPEAGVFSEAKAFGFDGVFGGDAEQREVFAQVGLPVLRECLRGMNGTILAYGQTGSGKTHSLLHQGQTVEEAGLLPQLVAGIFMHIAMDPANVYEIEASALQVYNEQVDDLLDLEQQAGPGLGLNVQNGGTVPGLTSVRCDRPEDLLDCFARARANIIYAETRMNKASSRSHAVFQVRISRRQRASAADATGTGATQRMECTHARLNVVDLAGSERVKKSGAEGAQLREANAINKSLLAFGNVVSALASKRNHVPFRDSKLTRILEGSIGGNSKTALLVCVSPATENMTETLSTLEFASRAMRVEVDARVNRAVVEVTAKELLSDLHNNISNVVTAALQAELEELRASSERQMEAMEREADEFKQRKAVAEAEASRLRSTSEDAQQLADHLRSEVQLERSSRQRLEEQLAVLHREVAAASSSAPAVAERSEQASESVILQLRRQYESQRQQFEEDLAAARSDAEAAQEAAGEWRDLAEAAEGDLALLRAELEADKATAAAKIVEADARAQAAVANGMELRAEMKELGHQINAMESEVTAAGEASAEAQEADDWHEHLSREADLEVEVEVERTERRAFWRTRTAKQKVAERPERRPRRPRRPRSCALLWQCLAVDMPWPSRKRRARRRPSAK
eukprot:TRINITY_DN19520_c0_g1_i1.p1 TRINITY_DN19520_c0_g1~~TRINITY_DN19520_c0_g1_i1.p1  ORF type:complete len:712 (-),score=188.87 TRINITY_DN19520_c0_g1_i1:257-2392(-)